MGAANPCVALEITVKCHFLPPCTMASSQLSAVHCYLYPSPVWGWRRLAPQLTWKGAALLKAAKLQPFAPPKELVFCLVISAAAGHAAPCLLNCQFNQNLTRCFKDYFSPWTPQAVSASLCVCPVHTTSSWSVWLGFRVLWVRAHSSCPGAVAVMFPCPTRH